MKRRGAVLLDGARDQGRERQVARPWRRCRIAQVGSHASLWVIRFKD